MNAILYGRWSPRPYSTNVESLDTQFARLIQYCQTREWPIVGRYQDEDASGSDMDRIGLRAALEHVCKIKGVLVAYSLDRVSRSAKDTLNLIDYMENNGACLMTIKDNIDTTTGMGRFMITVMSGVMQLQRERTSELVIDARLRMMESGQFTCANCPKGWSVTKIPHPRFEGRERYQMFPNIYEQYILAHLWVCDQAGVKAKTYVRLIRRMNEIDTTTEGRHITSVAAFIYHRRKMRRYMESNKGKEFIYISPFGLGSKLNREHIQKMRLAREKKKRPFVI